MFRKLNLFFILDEGRKTYYVRALWKWLRLAVSMEPNILDVSFQSPEAGNRSSVGIFCFVK
jgi:hypothetical protein